MSHPTDNLVRMNTAPLEVRAKDGGSGSTLFGHFSVYNQWTRIQSYWEGDFLERIAPGAFDRTFKERAGQIRVLYDHGHDPQIGNKPLGTPDVLRSDKTGAYYEVGLFTEASYVRDLMPAIAAGEMGASFRMGVRGESWNEPAKPTDWNPAQLPERTITDVDLYEFGPVTFPAYATTSAGLRSTTDDFLRSLADPLFVARLTERLGANVVQKILTNGAADGAPIPLIAPDGPGVAQRGRLVAAARTRTLSLKGAPR